MCRRCGDCCREKVRLWDGTIVALDIYCPALDTKTKLCCVYDNRQEVMTRLFGRDCLRADHGQEFRPELFPTDCKYNLDWYGNPTWTYKKSLLKQVPSSLYFELWLLALLEEMILEYEGLKKPC